MTIDEAKKEGFRTDKDGNLIVWTVMIGERRVPLQMMKVTPLGGWAIDPESDFPTRAEARDELKRRKAEASAKRVEARVAARKAAGTQVPPPETQDKTTKPVEHKLPDIPSWAPPLPEGYVPLGFGGTFKIERLFGDGCSTKASPEWNAWHMDIGWCGDQKLCFYIAPRDSEIVRLNFPWLAEEAKKAVPKLAAPKLMDDPKYAECVESRDWESAESREGELVGKASSSSAGPKNNRAGNKYHRTIHGVAGGSVVVDVYNVIDAFGVTCPACQHAIKKLLCAGLRNKGSRLQDLSEAVESASRAVTLEKQRN